MKTYRYQIRELATGRVAVGGFDSPNGSLCPFWWIEGSYSCDCNRAETFDRALGQDRGADAYPCSDCENTYVFDWIELDGVRFVENDRPTCHADETI